MITGLAATMLLNYECIQLRNPPHKDTNAFTRFADYSYCEVKLKHTKVCYLKDEQFRDGGMIKIPCFKEKK